MEWDTTRHTQARGVDGVHNIMSVALAAAPRPATARRVSPAPRRSDRSAIPDSLTAYRRSISPIDVLDPQTERDLLVAGKNGCLDSRNRLISSNLKFVWRKARDMVARGCGVPLQELINEGNVGLLVAFERYNLAYEVRFLTYADAWVRLHMEEAVSLLAGPVRVPQDRRTEMKKYAIAVAAMTEELDRMPTNAEIAARMGVSLVTLKGIQNAPWVMYDINEREDADRGVAGAVRGSSLGGGSAERPNTVPGHVRMEWSNEEDLTTTVSDGLRNEALLTRLREILDAREFTVIVRLFGLDSQAPQTLAEIAPMIPRAMTREERETGVYRPDRTKKSLGRERVRNLKISAFKKIMRDPSIAAMARDLLEV